MVDAKSIPWESPSGHHSSRPSMQSLEFSFEWEDAHGVKGRELASTWASLLVRVSDSVLTRVLDHAVGRVRERINVPLYPLAEWLVTNWWFLLHESELPRRSPRPSFMDRHRIGPSREGYRFPDMRLVSFDTRTRVEWKHDRLRSSGLEFLDRAGCEWIDKDEFRHACATFVDAVVQRLESRNIRGTLLQEEWSSIQSADEDERKFCETAAAVGWDPYAIDDSQQARVVRIGQVLSGAVFEEAIPILNAETMESELGAILHVLRVGRATGVPLAHFTSIRDEVIQFGRPESHDRPWIVGYSLARRVRERLELGDSPLPSWRRLSEALREPRIAKGQFARSIAFDLVALVEGAITTDANGFPAVAFPYGGSATRRYRFCRSLADVLMSPRSDTLLTKSHSSRQRRGRAFAAEFLAPSLGLRARIGQSACVLDEEDVGELAAEFGVSPWVIKHQVRSHRIAHVQEPVDDQSRRTRSKPPDFNMHGLPPTG